MLEISPLNITETEGVTATLSVEGNANIRIYKYGEDAHGAPVVTVIWPTHGGDYDLIQDISSEVLTLYVAATKDLSAFANRDESKARIIMTVKDPESNIVDTDSVEMQIAPIILAWNTLQMENLYTSNDFPPDVVAGRQIRYDVGRWVQDFMELGFSALGANRIVDQAVSLGHHHSNAYIEQMQNDADNPTPWVKASWSNYGNGGNIEVFPPYAGHPYGRVVMLPQKPHEPSCIEKPAWLIDSTDPKM